MDALDITVVCVFGLASGHLLKTTLEQALAELHVADVDIIVSNMDTVGGISGIILCSEMLRETIRQRSGGNRVYGVRSLFDEQELRARLLQALEDSGYDVMPEQTPFDLP